MFSRTWLSAPQPVFDTEDGTRNGKKLSKKEIKKRDKERREMMEYENPVERWRHDPCGETG